MQRHRARDAGIVAAATLVLLLALEGTARLLGLGAPPPLPAKAPGSFRIVALGGSTVLGVPDGAQGFVAQLERGLRRAAPGRPLDVRNLARAGAPSSEVRRMLAVALDAAPDLLIAMTGHNEFLAPPPGALQRLRDGSSLARALGGWLRGRGWLAEDGAPRIETPFPDALEPVDRASADFARATARYRENLAALADGARRAGVPLFLCTAPSNLADWPPAYRRVAFPDDRPGYEEAVEASRALLSAGDPASALDAARRAAERLPDDAQLLFLGASALRALGRADEARPRFERARDLDPIPRRAFSSFNDAVRSHAGGGVRVVDVARRFAARADAGLVGFELICDNCHPTPLGHAIVAREIAAAMAEEGLFLSRGTAVEDADAWLARLESDLGSPEQRRRRHVRWLLSNAIYAMKTPFFNYEASRRYLLRARARAPRDWRVYANLATLDLLAGDLRSGRRALRRAVALRGRPLDPSDRSITPYLAEALARSGLSASGRRAAEDATGLLATDGDAGGS